MKANAITRIVIYSIAALLLVGLLLMGLGVGQFRFDFTTGSGEPLTGEIEVDASEIQNLEIEWVSGDIDIQVATDGSRVIRVYESGYEDEENGAVWEIKGQTLVIRYRKPAIQFGFVSTPNKDLTIVFPAGWACGKLDIETVSGSVNVLLLSASEIELENVSADCLFEYCAAQEVSVSTVSGNVEYRGKVSTLECKAISADCKVVLTESGADRLTLESVSGDLVVGMWESLGFSAAIDSVSGHIYSDFQTTSGGGKQIYGDGHCLLEADTVSGDIEIVKLEYRFTDACDHSWDEGKVLTVPGDIRQEIVYTCTVCGQTRSENVEGSGSYAITYADEFTESLLLGDPVRSGRPGTVVTLKTEILLDADLELYVNGEFVCKQQEAYAWDGSNYWEFHFSMPAADVTVQLKASGGM